jgi:hypothetical protein
MIITEIFNFAAMIDLIVSGQYQPIYYFLGYLSTGARGQLLSALSEVICHPLFSHLYSTNFQARCSCCAF